MFGRERHHRRSPRTRSARLAAALVLVTSAGLLACERPVAITFTVTTTDDDVDAIPGDGRCETSTGACTLRAAVIEAAALGEGYAVTVHLPPTSVLPLTRTGADEDLGASGDLDTRGRITVVGHGATLRASNGDRAFEHHDGHLAIDGLTIEGGRAPIGGAVLNHAHLVVRAAVLHENVSTGAGGTAIHQQAGTLHLIDTELHSNPSLATSGQSGAVYLAAGGSIIQRTTIAESSGVPCDPDVIPPPGILCRWTDAAPTTTRMGAAGVVNAGADLVVVSSTISSNAGEVAMLQCVSLPRPGCFGVHDRSLDDGVVTTAGQTLLYRTTLLGNTVSLRSAGGTTAIGGSVVSNCVGPVVTEGFNIDEDGSCLPTPLPSDVAAGTLWIDTRLTGNGGPTRTHWPWFSPVANAIPLGTPRLCDGTLAIDQRGSPSPTGAACERGSVER